MRDSILAVLSLILLLMMLLHHDDTFAVFDNEDDCNNFFTHLNFLLSSHRFTQEKESNFSLLFLDVLVERQDLIV